MRFLMNMNRTAIGALLCGLTLAAPAGATAITGSLKFPLDPLNYYDPAQGYVPAGYGNETSNLVPISLDHAEFGFRFLNTLDFADFTESSLNVGTTFSGSARLASPFTQTFTADTAGFFKNIQLVDNSFTGLTYSVTGDTLNVTWDGKNEPGSYLASFTFAGGATGGGGGTGAVPEPASWAMMIAGFGLVGAAARRERRAGGPVIGPLLRGAERRGDPA